MQPAKKIEYKPDPNKFDLAVDRWDSQGMRVGQRNTYRAYIVDHSRYYERPVNSGNLWGENNQPIGRVEIEFGADGKIARKEFKLGAPHKEYVAPLQGADKTAYELETLRAENAAIAAELAALKREQNADLDVKQEVSPKLSKRS